MLEEDKVALAAQILEQAATSGKQLLLPIDNVCAAAFKDEAEQAVVGEAIPDGMLALDIGPKTVELFAGVLAGAKTIVWNGPMGVFEMPSFARGTLGVAQALAAATDNGATTVVGGGDSASAVAKLGLAKRMSHISTGGGASLEYLEGKVLPGVAALTDK